MNIRQVNGKLGNACFNGIEIDGFGPLGMTMSMGCGSRPGGRTFIAAAALMVLVLVGCQHPSTTDPEARPESWRVLERVGDVRVARDDGRRMNLVRPGETIADGGLVTVDQGALLILARRGVQLTAGENTSLRLVGDDPGSSLILDRGWLRARLATSVDRAVRIRTAAFDINSSSATLTLRAGSDRSDLSIEEGSAKLSTVDGRHQATLVAGAAARIDETTDSALMIRPASGLKFKTVVPLPSKTQSREDGRGPSERIEPNVGLVVDDPHATSASGPRFAILPASRLTRPPGNRPNAPRRVEKAEMPSTPAPSPVEATLTPSTYLQPKKGVISPATAPAIAKRRADDPIVRKAGSNDPSFDRLTAGLLDGL